MRVFCTLVALAIACDGGTLPPRGQILLYVTTDAPLPAPVDDPSYTIDSPPLFDRLRIEVFKPNETSACAGCTREFAVDMVMMKSQSASFGFVPPLGTSGYRARVRLFRSLGREPRAASTIERVVFFPPTSPEGILEATVVLRTDDVARPQGTLDAPLPLDLGKPKSDLPGSWIGAKRLGCPPGSSGEACIPGGAYWMGNPNVKYIGVDGDGSLERIVVLSPFYLDTREVTVAEMRKTNPPAVDDPHRPTPGWEGCTYTDVPEKNEQLPVNCLTFGEAKKFCERMGKRLPSEAELEYAQGALESKTYPWGEDLPACSDAVLQRESNGSGKCPGKLPETPGWGTRDRIAFENAGEAPTIVDLAGNVAEWARDAFQLQDEPCWGTGVFTNPVCEQFGRIPQARSFRGAAFNDDTDYLHTSLRRHVRGALGVSATIGFRCARSF